MRRSSAESLWRHSVEVLGVDRKMNIQRKPSIVVLGMISTMPVGGVIWQTLHYLIGLQRLGFDVLYAEDHGMPAAMFTDETDLDGSARAAAFLAQIMERFDLDDRWSYHAWSGEERYYGIGKSAI